jgi:cell division protein FtsL
MTATAQPQARVAAVPARAPQRAPEAPPRRPPLRVVGPEERAARSHRRRTRLAITGGVAFLAVSLFGVVVAHVVLTQNDFELQRLQHRSAVEEARYERLREQVAELESPARIVASAQERLGMIPPPSVKYLTPSKADAAPSTPAGSNAQAQKTQKSQKNSDDEAAMSDWSQVKHDLGNRP